ncbi:hypothetical protein DAEQUDRAFT_764374 [Daedalea quercina L-15889]|uniref:Restriction of telomere capping protein 4 n=1 Tax=Daedalea quercina L-15889 TaxID=1314783 RepID=A0A165RIR1_9APHY|nr:hypothetical protein DAEQUDRAFT_764374 [Daedalea quercina L-15889]
MDRGTRRQNNGKVSKECSEEGVIVNGELHTFHPDYKPKKLPAFKKNKKPASDASLPASQSSQTSTTSTKVTVGRGTRPSPPRPRRAPSPELSVATTSRAYTAAHGTYQPLNELHPNRRRTPSPVDIDSSPEQSTPRPPTSQRPKPRPVNRPANTYTQLRKSQDVIDVDPDYGEVRGRPGPRQTKRRKASPALSESEYENSSRNKRSERAKGKGKGRERESAKPDKYPSTLSYHGSDEEPSRRFSRGNAKEQTRTVKAARQAEFPLPPPLTSQTPQRLVKGRELQDFPMGSPSPSSSQTSQRRAKPGEPEEFPMDSYSPLSSQKSQGRPEASKSGAFPLFSSVLSLPEKGSLQSRSKKTISSSQKSRVHKGAALSSAESSTDNGDDGDDGEELQPFPLQTQLLESIGRSPPKRSEGQNSDLDDDEATRARKRRRADAAPNEILADILRAGEGPEFDEDDMVLLGREIDPHTLCPWCDERLPAAPSPHLESLITTARNASVRNPRPTNPLGLRAPVGMFVSVCQRHRFESHQVPKAQARGWPTKIDWERVPLRIKTLKPRLQEIIDDVDEDFLLGVQRRDDVEDDDSDKWADRPRKGSVFWRDVAKNVRKSGSRKATGVAGQLANFNKTQPGYYGELGYVIIHQTMYDMFPPASFSPDSTLPLNPNDFIQLILIPEATVSLIMEDMGQTREEAVVTLRDSAEYGVAMFPDDQTEGANAVDQGEQIIMKRAEARRRELEVEDRIEEELLLASSQGTEPVNGRPKPRRKMRQGATSLQLESEKSDPEVVVPDPSGKRKTTRKRSNNDSHGPTDSEASDAPSTSRTDAYSSGGRRVTRSQSRACSVTTNSDVDMDVSDHARSVDKPRPRPKARLKQADALAVDKLTDRANVGRAQTNGSYDLFPTSSPEPVPEVHWDEKGVTREGSTIDEERTPRPSKTLRRAFAASKKANVFPLQMARERHVQSSDDKHSRTMRADSRSDPMVEDENPVSGRVRVSRTPKSSRRAPLQRTEDHGWLLDDPGPGE